MSSLFNTPKFKADRYRDFRPLYPRGMFRGLAPVLRKNPLFLDLGCGAGQSTRSFLELGWAPEGFAVDPDPAMIAAARADLASDFPRVRFLEGCAEKIPLAEGSVDLVLIGSAIHWFDLSRARAEIERVLKPSGILFVFEYQFPKSLDDPELAERVRRRFNLEWKAPIQKPRGRLTDLLVPFRQAGGWRNLPEERVEWAEVLSLDAFLGHLFSQSRYLHAEAASPDPEKYREDVRACFAPAFSEKPLRFDLKPKALALKRDALIVSNRGPC